MGKTISGILGFGGTVGALQCMDGQEMFFFVLFYLGGIVSILLVVEVHVGRLSGEGWDGLFFIVVPGDFTVELIVNIKKKSQIERKSKR